MLFPLPLSLDFQEDCAHILVHLCVLGLRVNGALTLAEKSSVLVEGASIAANSSNIGTE